MSANLSNRIACSVLAFALAGAPAKAQPVGAQPKPEAPIATSVARIAADAPFSSQASGVQHYRRACGKKVLLGLMIGAGVGAAYGLGLTYQVGTVRVVPGLALLGGAIGADVGYYTCR